MPMIGFLAPVSSVNQLSATLCFPSFPDDEASRIRSPSVRCLVAARARGQSNAEDDCLRPEVGNAVQAIDDLEGGVALPRVVDLLEGPLGDHAAPAIRSLWLHRLRRLPGARHASDRACDRDRSARRRHHHRSHRRGERGRVGRLRSHRAHNRRSGPRSRFVAALRSPPWAARESSPSLRIRPRP